MVLSCQFGTTFELAYVRHGLPLLSLLQLFLLQLYLEQEVIVRTSLVEIFVEFPPCALAIALFVPFYH